MMRATSIDAAHKRSGLMSLMPWVIGGITLMAVWAALPLWPSSTPARRPSRFDRTAWDASRGPGDVARLDVAAALLERHMLVGTTREAAIDLLGAPSRSTATVDSAVRDSYYLGIDLVNLEPCTLVFMYRDERLAARQLLIGDDDETRRILRQCGSE